MPTINELKKAALNDAGYTGSISDAESKWLKDVCDPYKGAIPDMWRYALKEAGYTGFLIDMQKAMLNDLGHTGALPNQWYKYWRDTPMEGIGDITPPGETIDAPTEVTYIDETNPPSFNMNITYEGDGAVEVGDEPQKRYNGDDGELYTGDPISELPPLQPLDGFGDSELAAESVGYVQFRFRRDDGLGGYIYSDWSSASEGAYEIPAAPVSEITYTFLGAAETETGVNTQTFSVDIGAAAADRYILVAASRQNGPVVAPVVTAAGVTLDELVYDNGAVISAYPIGFWGEFVPSGTGSQNIVVPWAAGAFEFRNVAVWRIDGLPPGVTPKEVKWTNTASVDLTIPADAGDLLFFHQIRSTGTKDLTASSEVPARQADITGDGQHGSSADWTVVGNYAPFNIDCNLTSSASVAITFAGS